MRNACGILAALAVALPAAAWAQDRARAATSPVMVKPQVLPRQAPARQLPAQRQPPVQRQAHELSHTVQQGPAPLPALTPLDRPVLQGAAPVDAQRQVQMETRHQTSTSNVLKSKQDGEKNAIDNAK